MADKKRGRPKKPKITVDGQEKPLITVPSRDMPVTADTVKDPAILQEILEYAKEGCTLEQIANRLLVHKDTLYRWSKKYPEVKEVILEGNKVADDRVEMSLYEMCFAHDVKEMIIEQDPVTGAVLKQVIRTKHVPANATAIQYWLQNRRRDEWKNHQALEFTSATAVPVQIVYDLGTKAKPDIASPQ